MILSSKLSIETISANPRSFIILMVAVYISYFLFCFTSCNDGNGKSFPDTINDVELNGDHILDNRPLKVFVHSKEIDFGFCTNPSNAFVTINHMKNLLYEIGNRCEEQFGYPVEFISNPLSDNEKNEYLTYLDSGLSFDLLFPSKIPPNQFNNIESFKFFNDEFIEKQYYMNLSPYINDYCPDVYANMLDFNEVTDLYKKGDEIYMQAFRMSVIWR